MSNKKPELNWNISMYDNFISNTIRVQGTDSQGKTYEVEIDRSEIEEMFVNVGESLMRAIIKLAIEKLEEKRNEA